VTTLRALAFAPLIAFLSTLLAVAGAPAAFAIDGGGASTERLPYVGRLTAVHRTAQGEAGQRCGAALVAPTWAVTAAHCVTRAGMDFGPTEVGVSFGSNRADGAGGRTARVVQILRGSEDIALLRLAETLPVKSVPLAEQVPPQASEVAAFGWGRGTGPAPLEVAEMRVDSTTATTLMSVPDGPDAGLANHGDSGGPLLVALPMGGHALVGIARSVLVGQHGQAANVWVRTDAASATNRWIVEHVTRD